MVSDGSSDGELLLRARHGDSTAWEALVGRFSGLLWAVGRCNGLEKAEVDDVLLVTWMRLLGHLDSLRPPDEVGSWLVSTARHECLRILRRGGRQVPTPDDDASDDEAPEWAVRLRPPPESMLLASERQAAVWDALATLSPPCQRILRLFMVEPRPTCELVALALDMPLDRVGPTRRRCLGKLRERVGTIATGERAGDGKEPS